MASSGVDLSSRRKDAAGALTASAVLCIHGGLGFYNTSNKA
jgi:hypothetical protein